MYNYIFLEEVILAEDTTSAEDRMRIIAGRLKSYLPLALWLKGEFRRQNSR